MFMLGFPLLLIPFAIYNIIAFLMPGVTWTGVVATVHMASGADWTMSTGDILIALAIVLITLFGIYTHQLSIERALAILGGLLIAKLILK